MLLTIGAMAITDQELRDIGVDPNDSQVNTSANRPRRAAASTSLGHASVSEASRRVPQRRSPILLFH
jgi:hypothetical protein